MARPILYPLLFAFAPVFDLISANREVLDLGDLVLPVSIGLGILALAQLGFVRWLRDPARAALATGLLVFVFAYAPRVAPATWAGALGTAATLALGLLFLVRARDLVLTTRVLGVTAVALVALQLVAFVLTRDDARGPERIAPAHPMIAAPESAPRPDIFHIVVDGYGREDVLRARFGVEAPLADFLRSRDFEVSADARASYSQTSLSLASTLEMAPIQQLYDVSDTSLRSRRPLERAIQSSRAMGLLRHAGYEIVEVRSDYAFVELPEADRRLGPWPHLTEVEHGLLMVWGVSPLLFVGSGGRLSLSHALHRRHLRHSFEAIPVAAGPGPTYVFAHILAPHPPFVFEPDGSPAPVTHAFALGDGNHWHERAAQGASYVRGYRRQLAWLDAQLEATVDAILAADPQAVVLLHGDHGPGSRLHWEDADATAMRERMSTLLAVRWPGTERPQLPPRATPGRALRLVIEGALEIALPDVTDRSWFSTWSRPYAFIDVTERLER